MNKYLGRISDIARRNDVRFAIVFVVVNLHVLRNVALLPYIAVYLIVSLVVTVQFIRKVVRDPRGGRWLPLIVLLVVALLGTITSLSIISLSGAVLGLSRLLFAIPVLFAFYVYTESISELRRHIMAVVVVFTLASLTLPLQLITGPIPWFASASSRADLARFSSLVGSLTALGIIVGSYVVLTQVFRVRERIVLALLIAFSALISLSKAALINVALGLVLLAVLNRKAYRKLAVAAAGLVVLGLGAYAFLPPLRDRVSALLVSFGVSDGSVLNYDYSIGDSIVNRLVELPMLNYAALADIGNPLVYFFGGGFGMASTALVSERDIIAPMAHNQFAEAVTVFGFLGGAALIATMILILVRVVNVYRRTREPVILTVVFAYVLFLVNSVFANGTLYQPASASIFYLAMFVAIAGSRLVPNGEALDARDWTSPKTRKIRTAV